MKRLTKRFIARQGDVLFERVPRLPRQLTLVAPESGRLLLARGEATGHHHSVDAAVATLAVDAGGGRLYLTVEQLTEVQHPEHAPLPLEPAIYRVVRQREYTPAAIRHVAD